MTNEWKKKKKWKRKRSVQLVADDKWALDWHKLIKCVWAWWKLKLIDQKDIKIKWPTLTAVLSLSLSLSISFLLFNRNIIKYLSVHCIYELCAHAKKWIKCFYSLFLFYINNNQHCIACERVEKKSQNWCGLKFFNQYAVSVVFITRFLLHFNWNNTWIF